MSVGVPNRNMSLPMEHLTTSSSRFQGQSRWQLSMAYVQFVSAAPEKGSP
jgi:hypothetical protein